MHFITWLLYSSNGCQFSAHHSILDAMLLLVALCWHFGNQKQLRKKCVKYLISVYIERSIIIRNHWLHEPSYESLAKFLVSTSLGVIQLSCCRQRFFCYFLHFYIISYCIITSRQYNFVLHFFFLICSIAACMTVAFFCSLLAQFHFSFHQAFTCSLNFSVAESMCLEWLCTCVQKETTRIHLKTKGSFELWAE